MMKRIFVLLLAVCLMASIAPVIASADTAGGPVFVQLSGDDGNGGYTSLPLTVEEGAVYYFLNTEAGLLTEAGASADNYNVKIENPVGEVATMYLKGAYLRNEQYTTVTIGSINEDGLRNFDFRIYAETDSKIVGGSPKGQEEDIYYSAIGQTATGRLTITGPGKLTLIGEQTTSIFASGELLFKDVAVDVSNDMTREGGIRPAIHSAYTGDVIFDNTVANVYCNRGPCIWVYESHYEMVDNDNKRNIIIRNGSVMNFSNSFDAKGLIACSGEFSIDSSEVEINTTGVIFENKPVMTGVYAIGGERKSSAKEYKPGRARSYGYFKTFIGEAPTTEATTVPTEPATEPSTPATQPNATQPNVTEPNATQPNATQPNKTAIKLDTNTIVLIAALVVIVATGVAGTVIILKKKKAE